MDVAVTVAMAPLVDALTEAWRPMAAICFEDNSKVPVGMVKLLAVQSLPFMFEPHVQVPVYPHDLIPIPLSLVTIFMQSVTRLTYCSRLGIYRLYRLKDNSAI